MAELTGGYDHLGKLRDDLGDLIGLSTLVHELIQNADDAAGATRMTFTASASELAVWNDGVFTDCGDQAREPDDCLGVVSETGATVRCDFHSLRAIAAGAKRERADATGAFGIGFTAVMQVTDRPELISAGRHWIVQHDKAPKLIFECEGCNRDHDDEGTTFLLPWAFKKTYIRTRLKRPRLKRGVEREFFEAAEKAIPGAMIFLRRVRHIELTEGRRERSFTRSPDAGHRRVISAGKRCYEHYVLQTSFEEDAELLRSDHESLAADARLAIAEIAIPLAGGLRLPLHAVLPTAQEVSLGFRLSASFYPFQSRKQVKFEGSDAESEWNRLAVRAAAHALAQHIREVRNELEPEHLWSLLVAAYDLSRTDEGRPDSVFGVFWDELRAAAEDVNLLLDSAGRWTSLDGAVLLNATHDDALPHLQRLGARLVHPAIRGRANRLAEALGIGRMSAEALSGALSDAGYGGSSVLTAGDSGVLATDEARKSIWRLAADLMDAPVDGSRCSDLDGCALIPCGGYLAPPEAAAFVLDHERQLFKRLPGLHLVDEHLAQEALALRSTVGSLHPSSVLSVLSELEESDLWEFVESTSPGRLLRWFSEQILDGHERETLADLSVFPAHDRLAPLHELSLPGGFESDPFGIADLIDLRRVPGLRGFLKDLGADEVTLSSYLAERLAPAFEREDFQPDVESRRAFEADLIDAALEIDDAALAVVRQCPLLETETCAWVGGGEGYRDSAIVRVVMGNTRIVVPPDSVTHRAWSEFTELIDLPDEPRPEDVMESLEEAAAEPSSNASKAFVAQVVEFLGERFRGAAAEQQAKAKALLQQEYGDELHTCAWLPVAGATDWAQPSQLYRTEFRAAFETSARFVDLPAPLQERSADFLALVGVGYRPAPELVIRHLRHCVEGSTPVRFRVYSFLNDLDDDAALEELRDEPSVLVKKEPNVVYEPPWRVVQEPGSLQGWVAQLPHEFFRLEHLLRTLAIPEHPQSKHAVVVLTQIAEAYGVERPITANVGDRAVLEECWRLVEQGLLSEEMTEASASETLSHLPTWPNRGGRLRRPDVILVDDMPSLSGELSAEVQDVLIDLPRDAMNAAWAVGIRKLSNVLVTSLVRSPNLRSAHTMSARTIERLEPFARIAAHYDPESLNDHCEQLASIDWCEADHIDVERSLELAGRDLRLAATTVPVHLDRDAQRLIVAISKNPPWLELAIELSHVLCPKADISIVAGPIEKVLSATTLEGADAALDLLHVPRLAHRISAPIRKDRVRDEVFGDDPDNAVGAEGIDVDEAEEEFADSLVEDTPSSDVEAEIDQDPEPELEEVGEDFPSEQWEQEVESAPPSADPRHGGVGVRGGDSRQGRNGHSGFARPPSRARHRDPQAQTRDGEVAQTSAPWRMWVSGGQGSAQESREGTERRTELRNRVSAAAVARVLAYERDHGRTAEEMPPNNPGYDIKSSKASLRPPSRYIEVKGLAGPWEGAIDQPGHVPQLTDPQFKMSMDEGKHWVYVVEYALDDERWAIYPIQHVGRRANRYLLDHGWKEAAQDPSGARVRGAPATPRELPYASKLTFPAAERAEGDVPLLTMDEVLPFLDGVLLEPERWFTSPVLSEERDFAIQQRDATMATLLPFGAIAVFRACTADFRDGEVILANVGQHGESALVVREAWHQVDAEGNDAGILLDVIAQGQDKAYVFDADDADGRLVARLVAYQDPSEGRVWPA